MLRQTCLTVTACFALGIVFAAAAEAQMQQAPLTEETIKISEHVWAIMGFPNIAIVVGDRATLVVDTGMGPRETEPLWRALPPEAF